MENKITQIKPLFQYTNEHHQEIGPDPVMKVIASITKSQHMQHCSLIYNVHVEPKLCKG